MPSDCKCVVAEALECRRFWRMMVAMSGRAKADVLSNSSQRCGKAGWESIT
jgi:hypothetical protein